MNNLYEKYADVLVNYSVKVKENDLVMIKTDSHLSQPLIKEIYKLVLKNGAHPVVRCAMDGLSEIFLKNANDNQLTYIDGMSRFEYENATKFITIGAPLNLKSMSNTDPKKAAKRSSATRELSSKLLQRSANGEADWVIADFPTHALAQEAKMSVDEYTDFLIQACYLDLDSPKEKWLEISKEQNRIADILNNTKSLHIIGERTDITFNVENRKWVSCDGLFNFPDGEIFTSPVENDVNGTIYFDFPAIYRGNTADKIQLTIKDGKVIDAKAETGEEFLLSMLDMDEGSRYIGEIAVGTNERIQKITGNILFDEKIGGAIHMAVGASYPETGGKNISGLHWDMIKNMKNGGEIYADNNLIYKNGKFTI